MTTRKLTTTLTLTVAILGTSVFPAINTANAAPLNLNAKNNSPTLIQTIGYARATWKDDGQPYFFENCWWQKQRQYAGSKPTDTVRNKKVSCTDLAAPRHGWKDAGKPYFFENCWWQKQVLYKASRQTSKSRNRKVSCPGLKKKQ